MRCSCGHDRYGYTLKDGVLSKSVERSRHLLRKHNAWGIQQAVLDCHKAELTHIKVRDVENNVTYVASIETFTRYCGLEEVNKKFGWQYFLRLGYWTRMTTAPTETHQPRLV